MKKVFVGIVIGSLLVIGLIFINNWVKDPIMNKSGITILIGQDHAVVVPKGTTINGDAVEIKNIDGRESIINIIVTPCVTTKSITVACEDGENSVCALYYLDNSNPLIKYDYQQIIDKILLK